MADTTWKRASDYRNVARVTGKIGKSGEVRVEAIGGLPFLLHEGMQVFLTPPPLDGIRYSVVEYVREIGDGWAVKFKDCNSEADAFELRGRTCLVATDDIGEFELGEDPESLLGAEVYDEEFGYLGEIVDLLVSPAQVTVVVGVGNDVGAGDGDSSSVDEILIPLVDEFVEGLDDEGVLHVQIPKSLLELNASGVVAEDAAALSESEAEVLSESEDEAPSEPENDDELSEGEFDDVGSTRR